VSDKGGQSYGFSGLVSLADDVPAETTLDKPQTCDHEDSPVDAAQTKRTDSTQHENSDHPVNNTINQHRLEKTNPNRNTWRWAIAIVGLAVVLLVALSERKPASDVKSEPSRRMQSEANLRQNRATPSIDHDLIVDKPPIGTGRILNLAQIRWCMREKLRIETLASWGDGSIDAHNARVRVYNPRCGEFRYRKGDLSRAQQDVAEHRSQIVSELRSLYSRSEATQVESLLSKNNQSKALVREIQSLLNDRGFFAGSEDGLMGPKTARAIRDYQKLANLRVTGKPSRSLLEFLLSDHSITYMQRNFSLTPGIINATHTSTGWTQLADSL
jgi:hypothetical protein